MGVEWREIKCRENEKEIQRENNQSHKASKNGSDESIFNCQQWLVYRAIGGSTCAAVICRINMSPALAASHQTSYNCYLL